MDGWKEDAWVDGWAGGWIHGKQRIEGFTEMNRWMDKRWMDGVWQTEDG